MPLHRRLNYIAAFGVSIALSACVTEAAMREISLTVSENEISQQDQDNDGRLSEDEYARLKEASSERFRPGPGDYDGVGFNEIDHDRDGYITLQEYMKWSAPI